jgi:CRP-like cAMP-binding protein
MLSSVTARRPPPEGMSKNADQKKRRRRSVLDSTRNLMATLKQENERRARYNNHVVDLSDPIEQFLRRVDPQHFLHRNAHGIELDTEDDWLPSSLRCFMKPISKVILIPEAPGRLAWDVMIAMMIVYYIVMVPLRLCFDTTNPGVPAIQTTGPFLAVEIIFDILFIIDLFVNFRTAYSDSGELVTDSRLIAINYCRGWFLLDFMSSLPTTLITMGSNASGQTQSLESIRYNQILRSLKWIKLLKLMRVLRLKRITDRFEHIAMFWNTGTLRVLRSMLLAVTVWHILACFYFLVAKEFGFCTWADSLKNSSTYEHYNEWDSLHSGSEPNGFQDCYDDWVPWSEIVNQSLSVQYGQAFFWAVMVTTGVGKDINPQSEAEVAFTCICILIGVFMFSVIIGSLSSAIQSMDHKSNIHNQRLATINQFMHFNKIPHYMQVAIHQFYEYKWGRPETDPPFSDLPNILKIRLKVLLNREALLEVPVFKELPPDCMIALTQHVKSHMYFPTEFSTHQGQQNSILFIIRHGRMKLSRHPLEISSADNAKERWKALLHRWQNNEKKRRQSMANTALTAFRDAYILTTTRRKDDQFMGELARGNFYGANCLISEPEEFSCSALVFSEVLMLDMTTTAMKYILKEYPIMQEKLSKFAKRRQKNIIKQINQNHGIKRSKSLFGGYQHPPPSRDDSEDSSSTFNTTDDKRAAVLKSINSKYSVKSEDGEGEEIADVETSGNGSSGSSSAGGDGGEDGDDEKRLPEDIQTLAVDALNAKVSEDSEQSPLKQMIREMGRDSLHKRHSMSGLEGAGTQQYNNDPVLTKRITELESAVTEVRRYQDAQYQNMMEKLEELLANVYV